MILTCILKQGSRLWSNRTSEKSVERMWGCRIWDFLILDVTAQRSIPKASYELERPFQVGPVDKLTFSVFISTCFYEMT